MLFFRITFSETPPVFSKPKNVPRRKLSKDEWESVWEEHFPDEEEKVLKNFFLKSASETCRAKLGEEFAKTRAEIDSLHSVNRELIDRQEKLVDLLDDIELKQTEVEENVETIGGSHKTLENLESVLATEFTKDNVDDVVEVIQPSDNLILEAIVADEAINDSIYALGRVLDSDIISVETYLKKVRELSRKQFHTRQRINHLQSAKASNQ